MIKYIFFILIFSISNCFATSSLNDIDKTDLIIDTDMGVDDSIVITSILQHKNIHIPFMSIVADSNSTCKHATENLERIIHTFVTYPIPVACGPTKPLIGDNVFPKWVIDEMDKYAGYGLTPVKTKIRYDAVEQLYQVLARESKPVNILTIAPQTNLALLFNKHPDIIKKVKHIYSMGGALKVDGNIMDFDASSKNKKAEWNVYIDPVAYKDVLKTQIPLTIIPLDITRFAIFNTKIYNFIGQHLNNQASKFIYSILTAEYKFVTSNKWSFWDPMAAVIMLHPELANCEINKINIISNPKKPNDGIIIYDNKNGYKANICYTLKNKDNFVNEFISVITN